MEIIETPLPGVLVVKPRVHEDPRGFFMETYRQNVLADGRHRDKFVQDNHSRSSRGVLARLALPAAESAGQALSRGTG